MTRPGLGAGPSQEEKEIGSHYLSGGTRCLKHWVSGVNIYTRHGNNWVSGAKYFYLFIATPDTGIIGCLVQHICG